jgi:3-deoxy-D-manno-octulosonic acid kinase
VEREDNISEHKIGRYLIGADEAISVTLCTRLLALCTANGPMRRGGVVGPQGITRHQIEGIGRVVVKHYVRGGLLRFFMGRRYLKSAEYRSRVEYRMLSKVRALGISAPKPIAYIVEGSLWYHTWLVLTELEGVVALADLAEVSGTDRFEVALSHLVEQVERLIENRVFHVDLHPGNVVVDSNGQIFILDFDKATVFTGKLNRLRDLYLHRWRRAVIKHNLPESFSELFCAKLRRKFD